MLAVNYSSFRANLKDLCDKATDKGETIIVTRKDDKAVVVMSMDKYNEMDRIIHNLEYNNKLLHSYQQYLDGKVSKHDLIEPEEDLANGK